MYKKTKKVLEQVGVSEPIFNSFFMGGYECADHINRSGLTDRPDWDQLDSYCKYGLWDLDDFKNRVPDTNYIKSRNIFVTIPAILGFAKPQWKILVIGILDM